MFSQKGRTLTPRLPELDAELAKRLLKEAYEAADDHMNCGAEAATGQNPWSELTFFLTAPPEKLTFYWAHNSPAPQF